MTQVIYADVLFIINAYITYILMVTAALIAGCDTSRPRLTLSALTGGAYSLIVLMPQLSEAVISFSRLPAALLFIFIAFGKRRLRSFLRLFASFFLVNFIFAGLMLALWYFIHPADMYYGSFIVYFDIKPLTLIILTAVCYFIIRAINSLIKIRQPKNTIFDMTLHINSMQVSMRAFYDTGNTLTDPFTGKQVIIVNRSNVEKLFGTDTDICSLNEKFGLHARLLPFQSLGGSSLMPCFTAERVQIKGISLSAEISSPVIALTEGKIRNGDFGALLPSGIFDNMTNEKGEDYDENTEKFTAIFKA